MKARRFVRAVARATWSGRRSLHCLAAATFVSLFVAESAHAEQKLFVELDYRSDATLSGCPNDEAFRGMIRDQLGYDPFRPGSSYKVRARTQAEGEEVRGFIEWHDAAGAPRGKRELSSENLDCAAFARSMSFAIAVQIQLFGAEPQATPPAPKTDAERNAAAARPPPAPPSDRGRSDSSLAPDAAEADRWSFAIGAGPAIAFGVTPKPAFEARVFAAVRHADAALELGAEASLPARYETASPEGFEQRVAFGTVAACAFLRAFSGCLVNKWGRLQVRGFGVDLPREAAGTLVQLGPRFALGERFGESWLGTLRMEVLATLAPWRVSLDRREVWETPLLSLAIGADLSAIFGDDPPPRPATSY